MIQIENSFFDLANSTERNCLVICDRGAMDASAFISRDQWENILARNGLDEVEVRDNRYSQVRPLALPPKSLYRSRAGRYFPVEQYTIDCEY